MTSQTISVPTKKASASKGRLLLRKMAAVWQLYLLIILPILYLLLFAYWPMLGVQIAFRNFNPVDGIWGSPWAGLFYFQKFFSSYQFMRILGNTLSISIYSLVAGFPLPILLALFLNSLRSARFKKVVQTVTYIPHFISTVVLVGMLLQLFNPVVGLYGNVCQLLTGERPEDLMGVASSFSHMYVWSGIWQNLGWSSIIYVAALSGVDMELHEAAQIDGATRFQRILRIDLPMILPTATIMLILNMGRVMSIGFEKVYLMQNPLNLRNSEIISTYVYKIGLAAGGGDFSYASAIGLFNSVINFVLIIAVNWVSGKLSETSLW